MNQRDRLKELIQHVQYMGGLEERLADYLLENGVIVPPCKIGNTIYQYDNDGRIYQSNVKNVIYDTENIAFDEREIGKTVFLTREEAEKALEEKK